MFSPTTKHSSKSPALTFTVGSASKKHLSSLDQAVQHAARMSVEMGGKNVGVYIFAHTPRDAQKWGSEKGPRPKGLRPKGPRPKASPAGVLSNICRPLGRRPLGRRPFTVIHVKVNPPSYFAC